MERAIKTGRRAAAPAVPQQGLVYLLVLFVMALLGVGMAAVGPLWQFEQRREREQELLYLGEQYRRAIQLYYQSSPGPVKKYPKTLDELLTDNRYLTPRHYLRQRYRDPITGNDWAVVTAPGGGAMGVYSSSELEPIRRQAFPSAAKSYQDWKFIYLPNPANPVQKPAT